MSKYMETHQIAAGFGPVDMATAANDGDWVGLGEFNRLLVLLFKGAGAAAEDPTITLEQASDAAGAGAKALNFTRVYRKVGTLTSIGQFTKIEQAAANTYTAADLGDSAAIVAIEIMAADLDVDGGFAYVRGRVADVGVTAQIGALLYIASEPRYASDNPPSIID